MNLKQSVFYALFSFALICKLNSDSIKSDNSTSYYSLNSNGSEHLVACDSISTNPDCKILVRCMGQFTCANSRCISLHLVCNNEDECGDNSDERHCFQIAKSKSFNSFRIFILFNLLFIFFAANASEAKTEKPFQLFCHKDEFHCNSGECINKNFRCDLKNDCT